MYQDGPASWDKVTNQFYLTRSTANFKKDEVIQLDLYSLDYSSSNKKSAGSLSINLEGYSSIHPSISHLIESCIFQVIDQWVWWNGFILC